jgi:DNA-binding response OmpR family regulator
MDRPLAGRSILIVEDEPIIAMDIAVVFEKAGAQVTTTTTLRHATILVENDGLSAAVLDHGLGGGDSASLRERLTERNIPFVIYSGFGPIDDGARHEAPHVSKPAHPEMLVATIAELLGREQTSN